MVLTRQLTAVYHLDFPCGCFALYPVPYPLWVLQAAAKHEKQEYRIQHLMKSYKESEAAREDVENQLAALKT